MKFSVLLNIALSKLRPVFGACMLKIYMYVLIFSVNIYGFAQQKVPLLILCDPGADPSNEQSLIRLLLYSSQLDIKGICITGKSNLQSDIELVQNCIFGYGQVVNKLLKNENNYSSAEGLLDRVKTGKNYPDIGKGMDSQASDWIISSVDQISDKLWICIWDDQRELAQALWTIKETRDKQGQNEFIRKIRIHALNDKDHYRKWILENFPQIFYIADGNQDPLHDINLKSACYQGQYICGNINYQNAKWIYINIINNHGPLGSIYPPFANGVNGMKEYGTSTFMGLLDNGLNNPEQPGWGGFGGRFKKVINNYYIDDKDLFNETLNEPNTVARWRIVLQNDFHCRMNWCIYSVNNTNHYPQIKVNMYSNKQIIEFNSVINKRINIDASETNDPEGDNLNFNWWFYKDASDYSNNINYKLNHSKRKISFNIPPDADGKTLHLILEVTDNGNPPLTSFKRFVIHCYKK
jgi:hypothetical protein